ncbi:MAG TPA: DUF4340 domain-containing protein [Stellaceae bacterium]|nr:DUF4340 domain-containing protein [Stellaceae bacterium]
MQRRGFLALIAAAAIIAVLAIVTVTHGDREVSRPPTDRRALPGLADRLGTVAFLRVSRGTVTVNLKQIDKNWVVVEKGNYPAGANRIRKLLLQLAELELIEPKTDRPELLARLDLDDPANGKSTEITAQDRNGTTVGQVIIGRSRPSEIAKGEAGVYIRRAGSDQAWLARGAFELGGDALSWLDRRIIDIPPGRLASVVLTPADGGTVTLSRVSADQPFSIDKPPLNANPKPDDALAAPTGALDGLLLMDVRPASTAPTMPKDGTTASFITFGGLVIGLRLTPPEAGDWLAIEVTGFGKGEAEARALNAKLSPWRFAIPAARAKLLRTTLSDLLLPRGS